MANNRSGWIPELSKLAEKYPQLNSGDVQTAIARHVADKAVMFEFLDQDDQLKATDFIDQYGITETINKTMRQTDLMSELSKTKQGAGGDSSVNKLTQVADNYGFDKERQYAISEFTGVGRKLFKNMRNPEADQILNAMKNTSPDEVADKALEAVNSNTDKPAGLADGLNHVLDEETGELVEISDDMRRIAHGIQQRIEGATIITAFLIQMVRDEKMYLAFGCGSFQEYADTMLPFNRRTAYKYISISEKFTPLLPSRLSSNGVQSTAQIAENIASNDVMQDLSSIGTEKLYELTKIPDADFSEVMNKGVVKTPDGQEWSLDEIKAESSRKVAEAVKEVKKKYQSRLSNIEEDKKRLKEERDLAKKELADNKERIERSQEIEQKYGKQASRLEELEYLLDEAQKHLGKLEEKFGKVEVDYSDPESLRERAMTLLRQMTLIQEAARTRFGWLEDMDELSLFPAWKLSDNEGEVFEKPENSVVILRMDSSRNVIKQRTQGKYGGNGWKDYEKGFESKEQMQERFNELISHESIEEG